MRINSQISWNKYKRNYLLLLMIPVKEFLWRKTTPKMDLIEWNREIKQRRKYHQNISFAVMSLKKS